MDVNGLKGRIAEALVEGIFRRAGYQAAHARPERGSHRRARVQGLTPGLLVWKQAAGHGSLPPLHRLVAVEVRYRADVERALPREMLRLAQAGADWRDLYFIFVTDRPAPGRACFQVVDPRHRPAEGAWTTVDLHDLIDLDIYWKTIEEYARLVKLIFPVLSGKPRPHAAAGRRAKGPVRHLAAVAGAR
jgi:hypothetical protein